MKEMPRYKCHKVVWALELSHVEVEFWEGGDSYTLAMVDNDYGPVVVTADWVGRHRPCAGGYYVVYEGGYTSFSPKNAFEAGYERISQ